MKNLSQHSTFFLLSFFCFLFSTTLCVAQTSYTWDGSSSSAWTTAANWTPSGVPTSSDHVIITSAGNSPVLAADATVTNFTITSGTIDLGGYELTMTGNVSMTGGTVSNGLLTQNSTGTTTITGVTVNCVLNVDASNISINTSRFKQETHITKTDGPSNTFSGNVWEGNTSMSIFGSGAILTVGYSQPDTFLLDASFENEGRGFILGTSSSAGAAVFAGTENQDMTLTGSRTITARRVTVNKPYGKINLVGTLNIYTLLTLKKGIVDAKDGLVYINSGASVSGTSNLSYIDGPVEKRGNTAFTFPVGKNGVYRPISITAPSSSSAQFRAEYIENNSDNIHSHASKDGSLNYLSTNEYWTLNRTSGTSTPKVTLSWDTLTSCGMTGSLSTIHVAGWNGSKWKDLGNGATTGTLDKGTVRSNIAATSFNMFTLENDNALNCIILDTSLNINSLIHNDSIIRVLWNDHPSLSIDKYIVQRSSDLVNFYSVDTVITSSTIDLMTVSLSGIDPIDTILFSTESGDAFCFNEIVIGAAKQFDIAYRIKAFSGMTGIYSTIVKPTVTRNVSGLPPVTLSDNRNICPTSFDPPPSGFINTGETITFMDACEGTCVLTTYTLFAQSALPSSCTLPSCPASQNPVWDCECSCTYDVCCAHTCADYLYCMCSDYGGGHGIGVWQSCDGMPETQWIMTGTQDFNDMEITPTDPSICLGESITLSVGFQPLGDVYYEWIVDGQVISLSPSILISPNVTTTYEVLVVHTYDGVECVVSDTVTVIVNPNPTAGVSTGQTITCGQTVGLTATGGETYSWNTSPTQTTSTIYVSPSETTTYTVTVANAYGCTDQADVIVTVIDPVVTISGPDRSCISNNNYNFSVSGLTGVSSYVWSLPSGATYVSGQGTSSYTITDVDVEGYQVELTVNYTNGCSVIETYEVTSCCIIPGEPNVVNETFPFGANPGLTITNAGTTIANQTFTVNGTWTVSAGNTLVLDNCEIALGPDAKIVVPATSILRIVGTSHLHACDEMWDRIEVANGATIEVSGYSLIEDAETALHIYDGANTKIQYATFNRNWLHILIVTSFGTPVGSPPEINNCKFLCQTTASIGGTAVYENLHSPYSTDITNYGVNAVYARSGNIYANEFSNGHYGIFAYNTPNVNIDNNIMHDMSEIGMYVTQCGAGVDDVDIVNNKIYRTPYGIFCYDNPQAELKIDSNEISYVGMASPTDTMTGIFVVEITPGDASDPNTVSIHNNKIYKAPSGIHTMNLFSSWPSGGTGNVYIGKNNVTMYQPSNTSTHHSGIYLENHTLALVVENTISQYYGSTNWWEKGITSAAGVANQFLCNDVQDIGTAFTFFNDQRPFTTFAKNVMGYNSRGLLLNTGIIGQQGTPGNPNDNEWNGTGWNASHPNTETYGSGTDGSLSKFYVRNPPPPATNIYYPEYNENNGFALAPVDVDGTSGTWTNGCLYTAPSFKTGSEENSRTASALAVLEQTTEAETDRERGLRWAGKYGLYQALLADEELRYADSELMAYFEEKDGSTMGQLHRALNGWQAVRSGQGLITNQAFSELQSIQTEERPEQRLKEILRILFANATDLKEMDGASENRLRQIARMCPIDDGFGVYIARAALLKLDTLPRLYMSECEQTPAPVMHEEWKAEPSIDDTENGFSLYPNPNNGEMVLEYTLEELQEGKVYFYNALGQCIFEKQLNSGSHVVPITLHGLSSGLYSVIVNVNGQTHLSTKVSILDK